MFSGIRSTAGALWLEAQINVLGSQSACETEHQPEFVLPSVAVQLGRGHLVGQVPNAGCRFQSLGSRWVAPDQLRELRENLQTVRCSSCGAPIDLAKASSCPHCGTALSLLDMHQAARLIDDLKRAAEPRPVDPDLPLDLARAARESEAASGFGASEEWWKRAASAGLVEAGLGALSRLMKKP